MLMNLKQRKKRKNYNTYKYISQGGECKIHRDHHPCMNILDKKQAPQTCRTLGEAELIILNDYSLTNTVSVYSLFFYSQETSELLWKEELVKQQKKD